MHILIVTQYFWPENFRINDVALGLKEKGHEVTVLTGQPNYPTGRFFEGYGFFNNSCEKYEGIQILRVPHLPRGTSSPMRLLLNFLSFAFFASILGPLKCRRAYDAILVFEPSPVTVGIPALVMRRVCGAPILFWVQDLWPESLSAAEATSSPLILRIVEHLVRIIYRGCDKVLVQSRAFTASIQRFGVKAEDIIYLPNSAEPFYRPVRLELDAPEHRQMPKGFRVVFGGNIGKAQSFETILAAAEILREEADIHWIIVGDGRMSPWVHGEVRKRGLERTVHLLGRYPPESMPRYFALADALLVTLRKEPIFSLTIPSKLQSYLACGRPIIAALDGEGARVIHEAGAGLSVAPEDPKALAQAVLTLACMPEDERHAMGLRGLAYFQTHFERTMLLERLHRLMRDVTEAQTACAS